MNKHDILFRVAIRLDIHLKKLLQVASVTSLSGVDMNNLWAHSQEALFCASHWKHSDGVCASIA